MDFSYGGEMNIWPQVVFMFWYEACELAAFETLILYNVQVLLLFIEMPNPCLKFIKWYAICKPPQIPWIN
jgi:hypothetical protein